MSIEASRRMLLQMIGKQLLPLAMRREPPSIILMEPESLRRSQRELSPHADMPLKFGKRMHSPIILQEWKEHGVQASRFPCLLAVVEGEIDWQIGVLQADKPRPHDGQKEFDYFTVSVSEGTFFLTPAGVPYSDGHGLHWERSAQRSGQATLFWMQILPSGFMCHFCRSTATEHRSHKNFFFLSPQVYQLTKMLEKELADGEHGSSILAHAHVQAILIYAQRAVQKQIKPVPLELESSTPELDIVGPDLAQDSLQRARAHIEAHFQEPLNADLVAAHAFLSTRHLERHFQRELGMSITDYIIRRRIEAARVLLQDTDLLIRQVGEMVGFPNQSSFTQIFKRYTGLSPRDWRQNTTAVCAASNKVLLNKKLTA